MRFWHALPFMQPHESIALSVASDEAGFHGVAVPDHLFYPRDLQSKYPYSDDGVPGFDADTPWPDPWVLIGALAARTTQLRFTTNIYIAPARDLFTVAKVVATAASIAGDRVLLGVGAGWMREEFAQTGQDFASRGKRLNEMIPALRKLWTGDWAEHHGEHFDFDAVKMTPAPSGPIPILVGGQSEAALRRATTLGDGWMGMAYTVEEAVKWSTDIRRRLADAGRADVPFEIILGVYAMPSPDVCATLENAGVTGLLTAPWMLTGPTLAERVEETKRFGDLISSLR